MVRMMVALGHLQPHQGTVESAHMTATTTRHTKSSGQVALPVAVQLMALVVALVAQLVAQVVAVTLVAQLVALVAVALVVAVAVALVVAVAVALPLRQRWMMRSQHSRLKS
jgi:hypothetical protein